MTAFRFYAFAAQLRLVTILTLATLLSSCSPKPGALQKVTLRLNWLPDPTFAGEFLAKLNGLWKKRGLDVEIRPGGYNLDPVRLVASGSDDFGIVGADKVLYARSNGVPVQAIAVTLKTNPVGWVARAGSGIRSPYDFVGKKVGEKFGTETETIFNAVVSKLGIAPGAITRVPVQFSLDPFLSGAVDVFPVYLNEEPHRINNQGIRIACITPAKYGVDLYGNVLISSESLIASRPRLAEGLVFGLIEGWLYALMHPEESARLLELNVPEMDRPTVRQVLLSTLQYVNPGGTEPEHAQVGLMLRSRWAETKEILVKYGGLRETLEIDYAYNNRFAEAYFK